MKNKRKYFGTDGIRGKANTNNMNASLALNIGMATAEYFTRGNHKHFVLIGKDTRLSNYTIEPSLTAGFLSMGMNVYLTGPLPTPGVSALVSSMRCDVGVMISASHNHYSDNGIKIFGPDGTKLSNFQLLAVISKYLAALKSIPSTISISNLFFKEIVRVFNFVTNLPLLQIWQNPRTLPAAGGAVEGKRSRRSGLEELAPCRRIAMSAPYASTRTGLLPWPLPQAQTLPSTSMA